MRARFRFLAVGFGISAVIAGGSGCIGVSQKRAAQGMVGGSMADLRICRSGTQPGQDGVIDDFEDGNNQMNLEGGRDGYWWPKKDDKGSTLNPEPFAPTEGGADGSDMALHVFGVTSAGSEESGSWGAGFGVNMVSGTGGTYDGSKYAGIAFKAKAGANGTPNVRFSVGDVNTHPDGHVCKGNGCWNHFSKNFVLTSDWKPYRVLFTEMKQRPGWGDPRPAAVNSSKIIAIDWAFQGGGAYDIWLDDIQFIECK
jgi:hypothetical protein